MLTGFSQDLRFAGRLAVRQPWLTAAAAGTLALGIGATTAIFSVLHAWILSPLPYRDPGRLVVLWETIPSASVFQNTPAPVTMGAWRARATAFDGLAAWTSGTVNLTGVGDPARLTSAVVSRDLLPLLGVQPALGRNFTAEEALPEGPLVVLLTHGLWMSRFGGRPDAIGASIRLSGTATTIVGVLPPDVKLFAFDPDILQPLRLTAAQEASENRMLWVVGRLAEGATVERASTEVDAIVRERSDGALGARAVRLQEQLIGPIGRDLVVLFSATSLVLLVACANVASLTFARITGRRPELVVRAALGASRRRIVRQVLTETVLLGLTGGAAGLVLAAWAVRAVVALAPGTDRFPDVAIGSPAVFLFAFGAATFAAALSGSVPAWRAAGVPIGGAIREGAPGIAGGRQRLLRGLIAVEVAFSLALLAGAGLVVRSYQELSAVDLGFDPRGVVAFQVPRPAEEARETSLAFYEDLLRRLREVPGVRAAGLTQALPLRSMAMGSGFRIEGRSGEGASVLAYWRAVSPGFFETLALPLVAGRPFDARDDASGERVAIVTASFARQAWPGEHPLGRRIGWGSLDEPLTVIGVAGDVRLSPAVKPGPHVYMPHEQVSYRLPDELVVRSESGPAATIEAVRRAVHDIDASQPLAAISTMEALLDRTMNRRRFQLVIFAVAAGIALSLALVGIYGVLSYAAGQMAGELGLRVALGASRAGLVWQVMRLGLAPAVAGAAAGAGLAWAGAGALRGFLFGVEPRDPVFLAGVAVLLLLAAAAACLLPAWRAALADPLATMRSQ